jgi:amino acid transporter
MALAAFLAWVGLGADGLSSANSGLEETFLALGARRRLQSHQHTDRPTRRARLRLGTHHRLCADHRNLDRQLPLSARAWKAVAVLFLLMLNMRGMKESLKLLLPLFLGFLVTHGGFIVGGIWSHSGDLPALAPDTLTETRDFADAVGWLALVSLLRRAFALGAGTYTGIEAVSNNINNLKEPRVANRACAPRA